MMSDGGAVDIIVIEEEKFHVLEPEYDSAICTTSPDADGKLRMFAFELRKVTTRRLTLAERLAVAVLLGDQKATLVLADAVHEERLLKRT
jgi:hypothetical protein